MNLNNCYYLLQLSPGANLEEIKASYRRLARQYHPDVNSDQKAQAQFIEVTEAYRLLLSAVPQQEKPIQSSKVTTATTNQSSSTPSYERGLKWKSYQQLQQLLATARFARAIALVEGLAQRLPQDLEVRQWQAIAYQQWGRYLVENGQRDKGKIYFKKALSTDPHNRSLWRKVQDDLSRLK